MSDHGNAVQPLSLWDKIKAGAKSFVKSAVHYLPRGILFVSAIFAGSALLENLTGLGLLHINSALESGAIVGQFITSLAIGSMITGGIEAYKGVSQAVKENKAQLAAQAAGQQPQLGMGKARQASIGFMEPQVPSVPGKATELLAHTAPHFLH